ncbi:VTT domain-containing protein [Candidatus Pacearchaeota archaeon]|nr:VTT domain-containing protein [Candidatus Pacearchaeota archaeon]
MSEYKFVYETSIYQRLKVWAIFILIVAVLSVLTYYHLKTLPTNAEKYSSAFSFLTTFFNNQIKNLNIFKLVYLTFISELFFSPIPTEILFPISLKAGYPFFLALSIMLVTIVFTNWINYEVGSRLSSFVMQLISKKKVYEIRRWVNNYGVYAIFIANLTPVLPSPALSFAVGLTKYNRTRLFTALILGSVIKYIAIGGAYIFFK